jgi:hypothetical protein
LDAPPYTETAMNAPSDPQLLAECDVDTYRGPGPGGQKRNKTDSAVRLRHKPTGLIVIAGESRSQHENRTRALKRLREALALRIRHDITTDGTPDAIAACIEKTGRLGVGRRDARYLPCAGAMLDLVAAHEGSVRDVAKRLGLTTGNVSKFLTGDEDVMTEANRIRAAFGLKPLRDN